MRNIIILAITLFSIFSCGTKTEEPKLERIKVIGKEYKESRTERHPYYNAAIKATSIRYVTIPEEFIMRYSSRGKVEEIDLGKDSLYKSINVGDSIVLVTGDFSPLITPIPNN